MIKIVRQLSFYVRLIMMMMNLGGMLLIDCERTWRELSERSYQNLQIFLSAFKAPVAMMKNTIDFSLSLSRLNIFLYLAATSRHSLITKTTSDVFFLPRVIHSTASVDTPTLLPHHNDAILTFWSKSLREQWNKRRAEKIMLSPETWFHRGAEKKSWMTKFIKN